ncbi:hypothetical protein JTB14_013133 [Gonioctena quinquepunctata]|nr:hypothetical protein JTB14_013133 [Gonioctena quinquepunctata]
MPEAQILMNRLATLDWVVINREYIPTFFRGDSKSFIDLTLATNRTARLISTWTVSEEESLSLHRVHTKLIKENWRKPYEDPQRYQQTPHRHQY